MNVLYFSFQFFCLNILDNNKLEEIDLLAVGVKPETLAKIEAKSSERKTNSNASGLLEDNTTVTLTASLRSYHDKNSATNNIPDLKESVPEETESEEEDEEYVSEENEENQNDLKSDAIGSPNVDDFNFDVSRNDKYF